MKIFKSTHFQIGYQAWGNPNHRAVLFFHGFPGAHTQATAMLSTLEQNQIFLIAADRPGYGGTIGNGSTIQFLEGLSDLLAHHGVSNFDVLGVSGGSPFAHTMASLYADQVRSLGIICGLGPLTRETKHMFSPGQRTLLRLRRRLPPSVSEGVINTFMSVFDQEKAFDRFLKNMSLVDQKTLLDPTHRRLLVSSMRTSKAQNGKGVFNDSGFFQRDWLRLDCDIERLKKIPTFYFHGRLDRLLDHNMSAYMCQQNPNAKLRFFEDEGHYSLPLTQGQAIFAAMIGLEQGMTFNSSTAPELSAAL